MNEPSSGASTSTDQIEVTWGSLLRRLQSAGGSPIISYNLQWDEGTNGQEWEDLTGVSPSFLSNNFIVTDGVEYGKNY